MSSSPASAPPNGCSLHGQDRRGLAKSGVKRLAMVAPGFSADCLETLEELDVENREIFLHNGGEHFAYLPCLNDSGQDAVIRNLVERNVGLVESTRRLRTERGVSGALRGRDPRVAARARE